MKNEASEQIESVLIKLCENITSVLLKSNKENKEELSAVFKKFIDRRAEGFAESLQRILFINQCIWQYGHRLNGLGRLDQILYPYFKNDMACGRITKEDARKLVRDFLRSLHKYYWFKGDSLSGDTGQIIILGGMDEEGKYLANELSFLFIEVVQELHLPDPKLVLRASSAMPRELLEKAVKCIESGIGSPLLANDEKIVPSLIQFGYEKKDSYNYVTSACWEPLIGGKAFEMNNQRGLNLLIPFNRALKENKDKEISLNELMEAYYRELRKDVERIMDRLKDYIYEEAPLLSLFTERKNAGDISRGSAKYNNVGITTVGMPNVINSILNVKRLVLEKHTFSLKELEQIREDNFKNNGQIASILKEIPHGFGSDEAYNIQMTNDILSQISDAVHGYEDYLGRKIKIGLSSPDYIKAGKITEASLDGRKKGEPLGVHISSTGGQAYTELVSFASRLDYTNGKFNGNVLDMMVSPGLINNNFTKFTDFLMLAVRQGFFEMQMNVVSSKVLIEAKREPEKFPDLIVRVWGFSAYYKELPDTYKDVLIERALRHESVYN